MINIENLLFVDIETIANPDMVQYLPEPEAPGNYKDANKIASYIAEAKEKATETMALDPDFCKIKAIGFGFGFEKRISKIADEKELLEMFWDYAVQYFYLCNFNLIGFDLPVILRRSLMLKVKPSRLFQVKKYSTEQLIDFQDIINHGKPCPKGKGLKNICKWFGIHNPLPDLNGSMVKDMDDETLLKYNLNDIYLTQELAKMTLEYYW